MRFFLDTEFIEDGRTIDLVSLALVAEDGREYYAQNVEADHSRANEWVRANVLAQLVVCPSGLDKVNHLPVARVDVPGCPWRKRYEIAREVRDFVGKAPEFWAYYADYDWVAVCQMFGTMIHLPDGWPMFCLDIRQTMHERRHEIGRAPDTGNHHALADARWVRDAWQALYRR